MRYWACVPVAVLLLGGCTSDRLSTSLATSKNPYPVLAAPNQQPVKINEFIQTNYDILFNTQQRALPGAILGKDAVTPYLNAGFVLGDIYCDQFFRDADESQRRRKFGRSTTNDAGTAITAVLGLANAGQDVVTGVASGFGFADSLWRNYDDAFVASPDLGNVRALVLAAQDNFRQETFEKSQQLPKDFGHAQSVILRYANFCSTLGMKALLNQAADQQRQQLNQSSDELRDNRDAVQKPGQTGQKGQPPAKQDATNADAPAPAERLPQSATPRL